MTSKDMLQLREAIVLERKYNGNTSMAANLESALDEIEYLEVTLAVTKGALEQCRSREKQEVSR